MKTKSAKTRKVEILDSYYTWLYWTAFTRHDEPVFLIRKVANHVGEKSMQPGSLLEVHCTVPKPSYSATLSSELGLI